VVLLFLLSRVYPRSSSSSSRFRFAFTRLIVRVPCDVFQLKQYKSERKIQNSKSRDFKNLIDHHMENVFLFLTFYENTALLPNDSHTLRTHYHHDVGEGASYTEKRTRRKRRGQHHHLKTGETAERLFLLRWKIIEFQQKQRQRQH